MRESKHIEWRKQDREVIMRKYYDKWMNDLEEAVIDASEEKEEYVNLLYCVDKGFILITDMGSSLKRVRLTASGIDHVEQIIIEEENRNIRDD